MENLKKTPLHGRHVDAGAKMSPFGGFDMPIEYTGIIEEHEAVRNHACVFDVSHMGEVFVEGPEATRFVNYIFTNDVTDLAPGRILYGMMLNPRGGTVDDLLVYRMAAERYLLVINASNIDKDVAWIMTHAQAFDVRAVNCSDDWAELAIQGPEAESVLLKELGLDATALPFYGFKESAGMTVS
ncbi:MAG: glycine cleavage system aminomethyltransferase GcvT, partial [Muribaculaceae bacterium]|nr:glycine cleavage system aminomethyltransferase GcvT [Muribaculaceae bacterium]